jgi:hypothetical protein
MVRSNGIFSCSCIIVELQNLSTLTGHFVYIYRGFRQETRGPQAGAYSHPLFRRDQPEWCLQMTCDRTGTARKALPVVATWITPVSAPRTVTRRTSPPPSPLPPPPDLPPSNEQQPVRKAGPVTLLQQPLTLPFKSEVVVTDTEDTQSTSCAASCDGAVTTVSASPHTLTTSTVVTALSRHNAVLSQQAVARRNQAERLTVARHLLLQNYLAAVEMKSPPPPAAADGTCP